MFFFANLSIFDCKPDLIVLPSLSFTLNNEVFFPLLKILLDDDNINGQILFGSDYYMVETKTSERRFSIDLRASLGEKKFNTIAINNAHRFLKL